MPEILTPENLNEEYTPYLAMIIYSNNANTRFGNRSDYIEQHNIKNGVMQEGKPITESTVRAIAKKYTDTIKEKPILTSKGLIDVLLFADPVMQRYIWYRPAGKADMHFSNALNLPSSAAWMPPLLFVYDSNGLDVFALNSNDRPTEKTKLYNAPFHNTDEHGNVCMGNAKVNLKKARYFEDVIASAEHAFFGSNFTHLNGSANPCKTNINIIWKELLKSNKKFPMHELVENKKTLKHLLPKKKEK